MGYTHRYRNPITVLSTVLLSGGKGGCPPSKVGLAGGQGVQQEGQMGNRGHGLGREEHQHLRIGNSLQCRCGSVLWPP